MKKKIEERLNMYKNMLESSLSTFLYTNKRVDRDRVITLKAKIEILNILLKDCE